MKPETLDREALMQHIPHRPPMLLCDSLTLNEDGTVDGFYRIRDDEFFCRGHFPGNPMVPGVILCEIMAQVGIGLMFDALEGHLAVYRGIDEVKFKQTVRPGDLCEIHCSLLERKANLFYCAASLSVGGRLCCRGKLTFATVPTA